MSDENGLTPAERELASALGSLKPTAPAIDRDQLMFGAGRASVRGAARPWQIASVALVVCLAISLGIRRKPVEVVRLVLVPSEERRGGVQAPPARGAAASGRPEATVFADDPYARLCDQVMHRGLDALPALARSPKPTPLSVEQLLGTPRARPEGAGVLQWLGLRPMGEQQ